MVVRRQLRTPGPMRQRDEGAAHEKHGQPHQEVEETCAFRRHEQTIDPQQHHRQTDEDPGFAAPEGCAYAVGQLAQQGIGSDVREAGEHDDGAHQRKVEAERAGVVRRDPDRQRVPDHRKRQAQHAVSVDHPAR